MGGGGGQTKTTGSTLPGNIQSGLEQQIQRVQDAGREAGPQLKEAAGNIKTDFGTAPTLGGFTPNLPQGLDALSRSALSQSQADLGAQQGAIQRNLGQNFRAQPGVARALGAQSQIQGQLAGNPIASQLLQQQSGRNIAEGQLGLQAQDLTNRASLGTSQEASRLQQLGNQSIANQAALGTSGIGLEQGTLASLGSIAPLFQTTSTKQGGK